MKVDLSTWKSCLVSGGLFVEEPVTIEIMACLDAIKLQEEETNNNEERAALCSCTKRLQTIYLIL